MYNYEIRKNMELKIEGIIYNWDDRIPYILVRVINAITLSTNETELRQAIKYIASKTELEKFFAYGYGAHHFWLYHKKNKIKSKSCLFFFIICFSVTLVIIFIR